MTDIAHDESFRFGGKPSAQTANGCCGWPQGCTNMNADCRYLKHPYKLWYAAVVEAVDDSGCS